MIVCSAPRTGSTLVWQVASRLAPGPVKKFHGPDMLDFMQKHPENREPVIIPVRNRLDSYLSLLRTGRFDGLEEDWMEALKSGDVFTHVESYKYELACVERVRNEAPGDILNLPYNLFADGSYWLIDALANFLDVDLTMEERRRIKSETSIEANRKRQAKLSGFSQHDPESKIHGRHIRRMVDDPRWILDHKVREKLSKALNP